MCQPTAASLTENVSNIMGDDSTSFSIIVESDVAIVAERTMTWDSTGYGAHAEASVTTPASVWFLAEGSTSAAFDLFYLLLNPQRTPAEVRIRYLRPGGLEPIEKTYTLPPESRTTIYVDTEDPALAATDVSAVIMSTQNIVVERAMYWSRPGETFAAGHVSAGVSSAADDVRNWLIRSTLASGLACKPRLGRQPPPERTPAEERPCYFVTLAGSLAHEPAPSNVRVKLVEPSHAPTRVTSKADSSMECLTRDAYAAFPNLAAFFGGDDGHQESDVAGAVYRSATDP
jgi:hypothetical protein